MLEKIKSSADLKKLNHDELQSLCAEVRRELIQTVSENGGHLASNLGVVELTVALHRVFDTPGDKIVFDVGHQSYVHKMITGRYEKFGVFPSGMKANTTALRQDMPAQRFPRRWVLHGPGISERKTTM